VFDESSVSVFVKRCPQVILRIHAVGPCHATGSRLIRAHLFLLIEARREERLLTANGTLVEGAPVDYLPSEQFVPKTSQANIVLRLRANQQIVATIEVARIVGYMVYQSNEGPRETRSPQMKYDQSSTLLSLRICQSTDLPGENEQGGYYHDKDCRQYQTGEQQTNRNWHFTHLASDESDRDKRYCGRIPLITVIPTGASHVYSTESERVPEAIA
jgi:hypothetical protein